MEGDTRWSLDFLIALPLVVLGILTLLGITVGAIMWYRRESYDRGFALAVAITMVVLTIGAIASAMGGFFPYEKEYHAYVKKVGTVESVSKRLLPSGDAMGEKFVVKYTDGREFGCEDTRCALVKPGNGLTLACIRVWQYQGSDGYDCNFVERRP